MESAWAVIGAFAALILTTEVILWRLFARRCAPLLLARELDASSFGLWTLGRLRIAAIVHAVTLVFTVASFFLWVW